MEVSARASRAEPTPRPEQNGATYSRDAVSVELDPADRCSFHGHPHLMVANRPRDAICCCSRGPGFGLLHRYGWHGQGENGAPPDVCERFLHPELPNIQFATTILDVTLRRPPAFPGSRAVLTEQARVRVAIPTTHEHAELLFRPGNRVRVEGAVDCVLEAQGGAEIEAKRDELREGYARELDALPERWQQEQAAWRQRAQGRDAARQEGQGRGRDRRPPAVTLELAQRDMERRHRHELQRIGFAPRVQVMVGYVELIEGTPATLDESQELRRAFVKELRGRRVSNAAMRATASGRGRGPDGRREGDGIAIALIESGATAPGIDPDAGTVSVIRPRRASKQAMHPAPVELPVMEPTLDDPALEAHEQGQSAASVVAPDEQLLSAIESIRAGETEQDHESVRVG